MSWGRVIATLLAGVMLVAVFLAIAPSAGAVDPVQEDSDQAEDEIQSTPQGDGGAHEYYQILLGYPTVTGVKITLKREVPSAEDVISVRELGSKLGPEYSYFSIDLNLEGYEIVSATIEFKIEKSLLEEHDIDENSVKLLRLNSDWQELPTELVDVGEIYLYFSAETDNFSTFAVSVGKDISGEEASRPLILYAALGMAGFGVGFSLFYWFRLRRIKPFAPLEKIKRAVTGEELEGDERAAKPTGEIIEELKPEYKSEAERREGREAEAELIRRLKRAAEREEE